MAEWVDLLDPTEEELKAALPCEVHGDTFGRLLAPTVHDDEPRPRFQGHRDYVFGVLVAPVFDEADVSFQEVDLIVTREAVVTVRKTPEDGSPIVLELPAGRAGVLAAMVADQVAEQFLETIDRIDNHVDEVDDGVDEWPAERLRREVKSLRHKILRVRRQLGPTREALHKVVDRRVDVEGPEALPHDVEIAFGDAYDKLLRAVDALDLARDLLTSARDYSQAKIANDQNEVTKRLTVIASVLLVPTFIVGLYGQNFHHIPELGWGFGYWWSWGWILLTTALQLAFFRWLGWIGGEPLGRPKLPPLKKLDPRALRGRRRRATST
jgi:magnesium transporter